MVVGYDKVNPQLGGKVRGTSGGYAAVNGYDEIYSVAGELGDGVFVEAVAFVDAVGDVILNLCAKQRK